MQFPIGALAKLLGGTLTDPSRAGAMVGNVGSLDHAGPSDLAFLWNPAFAEAAQQTKAGVVVTKEAIPGIPCILVKDPQAAMLTVLQQAYALRHPTPEAGVHPRAFVHESVELGEGASVGPLAVVEEGAKLGQGCQIRGGAYVGRHVVLGAGCVIHPHATVLDYVQIGEGSVIWSGAIVGKDGFGFVPNSGDRRDLSQGSTRIPQIGSVKLGKGVEVGAATTIARGALDDTVIEDGVKIDDQVFVSHGCRVEKNVIMLGRSGLEGKARVEPNSYLMGGACIGLGRVVGEGAIVGSGAVVIYGNVGPGEEVLGNPHRPAMRERRLQVVLDKVIDQLPELRKRVKQLEAKLAALTQ